MTWSVAIMTSCLGELSAGNLYQGGDGGGGNIFVFCYKRHGYMMRSSKIFRRGKGECDKSEL